MAMRNQLVADLGACGAVVGPAGRGRPPGGPAADLRAGARSRGGGAHRRPAHHGRARRGHRPGGHRHGEPCGEPLPASSPTSCSTPPACPTTPRRRRRWRSRWPAARCWGSSGWPSGGSGGPSCSAGCGARRCAPRRGGRVSSSLRPHRPAGGRGRGRRPVAPAARPAGRRARARRARRAAREGDDAARLTSWRPSRASAAFVDHLAALAEPPGRPVLGGDGAVAGRRCSTRWSAVAGPWPPAGAPGPSPSWTPSTRCGR